MVHFRYHIVTLAAIFLSLGVGILLGGTTGRNWFDAKQQALFISMEEKYDKALQSNVELREQIKQLISQVEQSNHEVINLMAVRYAEDLQGQEIFVWYADEKKFDRAQQTLAMLGIKTKKYQREKHVLHLDVPLIIFGEEEPEWVGSLPDKTSWIYIQQSPDSPAKQWELLGKIQMLVKEKRREHEKS